MEPDVGLDHHVAADRLAQIPEHRALLLLESTGDFRIHAKQQTVPVQIGADFSHLVQDFVADRRARLDDAAAGTVRTRLRQRALEALFHPLARDDDEAEVGDLKRLRRRSILPELLFDRLKNFLAVLLLLHVDEVEHDDAAEIPQPELTDDLPGGFEIRLDDRVFQPTARFLADVTPGVDIDRDQRFGLVDNDRAPRLQPDLALQRVLNLGLYAILLEDRIRLRVELHPRRQVRHDAPDELEHPVVLLFVIDANRLELVGQQIAQKLADETLLAVDNGGGPFRLHVLADVEPGLMERLQVGQDVFLAATGGRRADDDASREATLLPELTDDAPQACPLVARLDLARDADVVDRRHEDQEPAGHGDMRRQPGALRTEGLLDDLDEDLLAFLQQFFDFRLAPFSLSAFSLARAVVIVGVELVELLHGVDDICHIEET